MRVLLAEDTKDLNKVITTVLNHENYQVDSAFDGQEAMDFIENDSYDCIILDIMMPKKDGISVLKELRARHILTPVILLTAKAEIDDRVAGLDAGADDYLPKPFAMKELLARMRSLIRRGGEYSAEEISLGGVRLNAQELAMTSESSIRLSIKEFELMQLLMVNADRSLSTSYILEHVWKNEEGAMKDTVWLYISYLKAKLVSIRAGLSIEGNAGGSFRLIKSVL